MAKGNWSGSKLRKMEEEERKGGGIWRVLSNFLEANLVKIERELGQRSRV